MQIVMTGGAGFIGKKLARQLLDQGSITGSDGQPQTISKLIIADIAGPEPAFEPDPRLEIRVGDFSTVDAINALIGPDTGLVIHLAAVVSGGAEHDFDLGMRVNLHSSMYLLEACRRLGTCPRVLFASSVAVYGGDLPERVDDSIGLTPQSSYGTQKAVVELLINDYSRRGFIDGRALRLPTIVVRPGKPNKALSSFASAVVREPLQGQRYVCPVGPQTAMWVMSPRRVLESLMHAAELPAAGWGYSRAVALPGITVTLAETMDALRAIAGSGVVERVQWRPDPAVEKVIHGWPVRFSPQRGLNLGFQADKNIADIIQAFIDDELGGAFVA